MTAGERRETTNIRDHTYSTIEFADPFKVCTTCGKQVTAVLLVGTGQARNRCDGKWMGHIGYADACPSWGPVDGCSCMEFLGYVPHPPAAEIMPPRPAPPTPPPPPKPR